MLNGDFMTSDGVTLLVGTTKGAFLVSGGNDRTGWVIKGPLCDGWPVNHMVGDPATGRLWAGGGGDWYGAAIWSSADNGETWKRVRLTRGGMDDWAASDPDVAAMIGWTAEPLPFADSFSQIWSLCFSHGRLYAGVKPAGLLVSTDGGGTWNRIEGLDNHPSAGSWTPRITALYGTDGAI